MAEKKITLQQSPNLAGPIPEFIKMNLIGRYGRRDIL